MIIIFIILYSWLGIPLRCSLFRVMFTLKKHPTKNDGGIFLLRVGVSSSRDFLLLFMAKKAIFFLFFWICLGALTRSEMILHFFLSRISRSFLRMMRIIIFCSMSKYWTWTSDQADYLWCRHLSGSTLGYSQFLFNLENLVFLLDFLLTIFP